MKAIEWWYRLDAGTQAWLVAHNGEVVTEDVVDKIMAAGGVVTSDAWWIGERSSDGLYLSDEAVDWVESKGNGE